MWALHQLLPVEFPILTYLHNPDLSPKGQQETNALLWEGMVIQVLKINVINCMHASKCKCRCAQIIYVCVSMFACMCLGRKTSNKCAGAVRRCNSLSNCVNVKSTCHPDNCESDGRSSFWTGTSQSHIQIWVHHLLMKLHLIFCIWCPIQWPPSPYLYSVYYILHKPYFLQLIKSPALQILLHKAPLLCRSQKALRCSRGREASSREWKWWRWIWRLGSAWSLKSCALHSNGEKLRVVLDWTRVEERGYDLFHLILFYMWREEAPGSPGLDMGRGDQSG